MKSFRDFYLICWEIVLQVKSAAWEDTFVKFIWSIFALLIKLRWNWKFHLNLIELLIRYSRTIQEGGGWPKREVETNKIIDQHNPLPLLRRNLNLEDAWHVIGHSNSPIFREIRSNAQIPPIKGCKSSI